MTTPPPVSPWYTYVFNPLERAFSTFWEQFSVLLAPLLVIAANGRLSISGAQLLNVLDVSGFAAGASIITSVATFGIPKLNPVVDLVLRVVKTYIQSVGAAIFSSNVTPSVLHASWLAALIAAVPVAGFALIKGLATIDWSVTDGASLLPVAYKRTLEIGRVPEHLRPHGQAPSPLVDPAE